MNANIQLLKRVPPNAMLWEWRWMLSKKWNVILRKHKHDRLPLIKYAQHTLARQTISNLCLFKRGSCWYRKAEQD